MYVVTFYSFKGGTGRSMALVNVAAELVSRGRRVLIVDFDLEAPGLDTFPMTLDRPIDQGIVEMITSYLTSDSEAPPIVSDFLYEARLDGVTNGSLWIMPAGRQDSSYDMRFREIDWQDFYENEGGFLFFEDLKAQWAQTLKPDYVLIDSRTGHTDIGGICTRQLPDCVVAMFFPNEQNLRGLVPIVKDIRKEEHGPLQKNIELHFVMGNVPDLDDEDAILSHAQGLSQITLQYKKLAATIHHFNSLSMLEQRLLLVERPRSKIAIEYKQLVSAIVQRNLEDRDGAIAVLDQALSDLRSDGETSGRLIEGGLQAIRTFHSRDNEILRRLARFRRAQRRTEDALDLFDQILQSDENDPESLVGRAEILTSAGKNDAALTDLASFFRLSHVLPFTFSLATRLLIINDRTQMSKMLDSPAASQLPINTVLDILQDIQKSYDTVEYGVAFVRQWKAANSKIEVADALSNSLVLCLIACGRYDEAKQEIRNSEKFEIQLADSFNYAMAEWGATGSLPRDLFDKLIASIESVEDVRDANTLQCFSLAHWAVGNKARADYFLDQATVRFKAAPITIFSAWTYLYRSPKDFRADLDAMNEMYRTGEGVPTYIGRTQNLFPDTRS
jgi:MinD-like ATPase involved in chromosome partitioning or flagellar assembly